jgi:hypothetical protein
MGFGSTFKNIQEMLGLGSTPVNTSMNYAPATMPLQSKVVPKVVPMNSITQQQKNYWTPDMIRAAMELQTPAMKDYTNITESMKPLLAAYMAPSMDGETNISPILAASDFMTGSNFLKNYKSPKDQRRAELGGVLNSQMEYAKTIKGLADTQKDLLSAQLLATSGTTTSKVEDKFTPTGGSQNKPPSQQQFKDASYAKRMENAQNILDQLNKEGFDPASLKNSMSGILPEVMKPQQVKAFQQANEMFINAQLRDDTGAAINRDEGKKALISYTDQAGDSPEVKAQKRAARLQQIEVMRSGAGDAYKMTPSISIQRTPVTTDKIKRMQELKAKKNGG